MLKLPLAFKLNNLLGKGPIAQSRNALIKCFGTRKYFSLALAAAAIGFTGIKIVQINSSSKVNQVPLAVKVFALGKVQPISYIRSIQYPMIYSSSRIQKLYVDENDFVKKGSPLFTLEDSSDAIYSTRSSKAQIDEQKAQLKSAEAKMLSSKSIRDFYKDQVSRYLFLSKMGAVTTEQANEKLTLFNSSQQDYQANVDLVKANRSSLDSLIWQYRANRFKSSISTVRAPFNVKVFKIYSRPGESIQNGKPVMDVGEVGTMAVLVEVHRIDIMKVRLNQTAIVTANGLPNIHWKGKVVNISRQVSQQSINSDDPAATMSNRVFNVLLQLSPAASVQAQNYNYMEVNVFFDS